MIPAAALPHPLCPSAHCVQERLQQYDKKVRRAVAEKVLSQSKRSLEVRHNARVVAAPVARPCLSGAAPGSAALCLASCCRKVAGSQCRQAAMPCTALLCSAQSSLCSPQVNVAAVNRFISAAVPDLSQQQKAALKAAGQKRKAGGEDGGAGAAGSGGEAEGREQGGEAAEAAAAFLQETMAELEQGQQGQQQEGGRAAGSPPGGSGKKQKKGRGKGK